MVKFKSLVVTLLVGVLLLPVTVVAQNNDNGNNVNSTEATITSEQEETQTAVQEEIDKQRAELRANLDTQRTQLLKRKCVGAQKQLQKALTAGSESYQNRNTRYTTILENVNGIVVRVIANQEVDTTTLEANLENIQTMVQEFDAEFELYKGALEGASNANDCAEDPTQFHENLEYARQLRASLKTKAKLIKDSFINDLKSSLSDLKDQIKAASDTEEDVEAEEGAE